MGRWVPVPALISAFMAALSVMASSASAWCRGGQDLLQRDAQLFCRR